MKTKHMRIGRQVRAAVVAALAVLPVMGLAANWTDRTVGQLQSTYDGADCIYFTLEGVAEADPVKPGDHWFAIPRTQYGAKDAYAMLLAAKLTGKTVFVSTRGTLSCGYAAVSQVLMQ
jgi:hypothetical protein